MSEYHPRSESAPPGEQPGQGANGQRPDSGTTREAVGQVLAGRFEVHEEIGSGAFAVTYRGRDRRLGRSVAIKVLRQTYATSPSFVQSVEREARAAALVTHGNVVDVYDFGQHGELLYMVMQYIEGEDLKHLIARDGPLPERRAIEITLQMLAGLAAVHQAGIIHRDIKPQNVMIGRDGIARVTDFGIARVTVDVGLTTTGTTVGTASYMAPEQAQGGPLVEATDLYSVGVVLYEMLTGRLPFEAPTTIALMLAHIQSRPVSPSARAPGQRISPEVDAVVMRALAKRPEDRFVNAPAMARSLAAALGDVPAVKQATQPVVAIAPDTIRTGVPTSARRGNAPAAGPVKAEPRSHPRRGLWVLPLLLVLLLAGGLGGAALFREFGDDGNDDTPRALVANLNLTPDAEEAAVETPTGQPVSTDTPEPNPTDTPAPSPTRTPEPTATDTAPPTRVQPTQTLEPAPTDTPVPLPTRTPVPIPTDPPAEIEAAGEADGAGGSGTGNETGETIIASGDDAGSEDEAGEALITRRDEVDRAQETSDEETADQTGATDEAGEVTAEAQGESGTMTMSFAASDWQGAYFQETGNMRPWSALYAQSTGYGSGSLNFNLDGEPVSGTFTLTVDGMTSENWTELPIAVLINGQEVYSGNSPFPTWNGIDGEQPWRTVSIELPTSALQQGENTLTFVNLREEGEFSRPPYILLADGAVTIEVLQPGAVRARYGVTSPMQDAGSSHRRRRPGTGDRRADSAGI